MARGALREPTNRLLLVAIGTLVVLAFTAAFLVPTSQVESVTAQSATSTPTPTPTPMATQTGSCSEEQCIFPCRGNCNWVSDCFSPPQDTCYPLSTWVRITADQCDDDIYAVDAYLYDDAACQPNSDNPGYLGGGNLTLQDGVWVGEFVIESGVMPDTVYLCWMGTSGQNYWTDGLDRMTINWACVSSGP